MEARTYSRKQMGVVYRAVKEGNIELTKDAISALYDHAGDMLVTNNDHIDLLDSLRNGMRAALDAIFGGDYEKAQEKLDAMVEAIDSTECAVLVF